MRALLMAAGLLAASAHAQMTPSPPMGRLFLTPAERAQLDLQRGRAGAPPVVEAPPPAAPAAPPPAAAPVTVTVNGIVRRSSGAATVWLNNVAQDGAAAHGAYALPLPAGGSLLVKPGQSADPATGALKDADAPR